MKTVVITGANTGIGYSTAKHFLQHGHHVVLACRNIEKTAEAQTKLQRIIDQSGKGKVETIQLDLNNLSHVQQTANEVLQRFDKIDVLVNNAGLMTPHLETTVDGFEKHIGVNYLAHFLWTIKLLPLLKQSDAGRIIHLASLMHLGGAIQFDQFFTKDVKKFNGVKAYANSKLANLLFSHALAEELKGTNVTSNALHPGGVVSDIYRDLPMYQYLAIRPFLISPKRPAKLIYKIALDSAWANQSGQYASLQTPAIQSRQAKNRQLAHQLFDTSYALVKDFLD